MTKTAILQLWVLLLLAVVHKHGNAHAFSTLAPPAPRTTTNKQKADVAPTIKITWERDVEEKIRRGMDDHRIDQMPYLVAVVGIPGR